MLLRAITMDTPVETMDICICFVGDFFINGTGDSAYLGWSGHVCAAANQRGSIVET